MAKLGSALLGSILALCLAVSAWAAPSDELVRLLGNSVLRVQVNLPDGRRGLGSAVVVAKNEVVTNCHVVNDATEITVMQNDLPYAVTAIRADRRHDLCVLTVENLDAPAAHMRASRDLKHEESIFTVGYPDQTTRPVNTYGAVKGMFPMDGGVVIRASSSFRLGASGGGAFDDAGNLVGIITLKTKGNDAYYYYMPVEWVQALMQNHNESLEVKNQKPFWTYAEKDRPYFMRVVRPFQNRDWDVLLALAQEWVTREPNTAEAWFYLATAEFAKSDYINAEAHFQQVLTLNKSHLEASECLSKILAKLTNLKLASR